MKNILCFGDSNTFGWDPATHSRFTREHRWPGILAQELGSDFHIIEEGCGGRTTVMEDGIEPSVSGIRYLTPCLRSHTPLNVVIIMLGTNDLKNRYSLSPLDISGGISQICSLTEAVLRNEQKSPSRILLVSPIHIGAGIDEIPEACEMFGGGTARRNSLRLAEYYKTVAERQDCDFLDAAEFAEPSKLDCVHLDAEGHDALGRVIAQNIRRILTT